MRAEDEEVDRPRESLPCEARCPVKVMIEKIRGKEKYGSGERGQLAVAMSLNLFAAYKKVAGDEEDAARRIQDRIQMRQSRNEARHKLKAKTDYKKRINGRDVAPAWS